MDLLLITWNYPPRRGGIENLLSSLCEELKKSHSVQVITAHAQVSGRREKDVFRAPLPGLIPFAFYTLWRGAVLLARNPQLRVVLGGSVLVTPLVLILTRLFARRAVIQAHGLDLIYRRLLYQQLCVRWLKSCDGVVANSRYTAQLAQLKGVPADRIAVISPGVRLERFSKPTDVAANKRAWGVEGKKTILFVGRLAKKKGVKEFIEKSLSQVLREIPEVCFVIVGDNPSDSLAHREDAMTEIKAAISKNGLESHVHLLGPQSDDQVSQLYQACDLVVLPALDVKEDVEGVGIVLLEAGAAGKPVVATRIGGIPDAVEDGKSGILVEAGDYNGLSRSVIALLTSEESRSAMGEYARRRVQQSFCWERIVEKYEAALELQSKPTTVD